MLFGTGVLRDRLVVPGLSIPKYHVYTFISIRGNFRIGIGCETVLLFY